MQSGKINIISINAKSLRSESKWVQMMCFLDNNSPDICLVQETNIAQLPEAVESSRYDIYLNPST